MIVIRAIHHCTILILFLQSSFQVHIVLFSCEFEHLAIKQYICVDHDTTRIPRNQNSIGFYYIEFRYKILYAKIFLLYIVKHLLRH